MGATSFENVTEGSAPNKDGCVTATKAQLVNNIETPVPAKPAAKCLLIISDLLA
jgi:hypothetical protein